MPPQAVSPVPGIVMVLAAMSVLPLSDVTAKYLALSLPLLQVAWARYFFHFIFTLPIALAAHGPRALWPHAPRMQLLRGALLMLSTICFYAGLRRLPVADSVAVLFVAPLAVTVLAPFALGERVGIRRYTAAAIGFVGALVIIRPGGATYGWHALFPMMSGLSYAGYILITRRIAGTAPAVVSLGFTALIGAGALTATLPFVWQWPTLGQAACMVAMGPLALGGHYLLIRAHEGVAASLLAPFQYWQIVSSAAVGFAVFGDFPDRWTWIGSAILIASGLYVTLRERQLALRAKAVGP